MAYQLAYLTQAGTVASMEKLFHRSYAHLRRIKLTIFEIHRLAFFIGTDALTQEY